MPKTVRLLAAAAVALTLAATAGPAFAAQPSSAASAAVSTVATATGDATEDGGAIGWDITPAGVPGIGWD
ncbi:hypothetical protein ACFVVX_22415 [Kitasatospora sp. NPDC058170]|uniref:hypothetical protein n=1 Tax=Kitasatospora sp. NPDC058170 TaxID=3346364 RepID=UPI0036DAA654